MNVSMALQFISSLPDPIVMDHNMPDCIGLCRHNTELQRDAMLLNVYVKPQTLF